MVATNEPAPRERIETITDRHVIKVKTGDRRAALWQDEDGTWWLPPRKDSDSPHAWFTYVTEDWVDHMATSAELDDLLTNGDTWTPVNPSSDGSEHFSHWAKGSIVTLAYATGIEIVGLCGASVVAHRDYEKLPICPNCRENLELLRQLRRSPEP